MTRKEAMKITENWLEDVEWMQAHRIAREFVKRFGFWSALYHVQTLSMHTHVAKPNWTDAEIDAFTFWCAVRNIIFQERKGF